MVWIEAAGGTETSLLGRDGTQALRVKGTAVNREKARRDQMWQRADKTSVSGLL